MFFVAAGWPPPEMNEPHYLGKARHFWQPDWIRGDFFLNSHDTHLVFYVTLGWLAKLMSLPAMAWCGRILTWGLLAWAWRRLSWALLPRPGWAVLSAAWFVLLSERFQMAGEWVVGGFEAKGLAYALVFFALRKSCAIVGLGLGFCWDSPRCFMWSSEAGPSSPQGSVGYWRAKADHVWPRCCQVSP